MNTRASRIFAAETIGTFVLVLAGPGSAVLATGGFTDGVSIGVLGVALSFGLALLAMAYAIGPISGCHINPAVTVGLLLARKVQPRAVPVYVGGQLVGAVLASLSIWGIAAGAAAGFSPDPTNLAVNGWGELSPGGFGFGAMVITEVLMTAVLVFVVLSTTHRRFSAPAGGLAVGLTLTLIHLVSIPVTNTSVNPARSFGVAVIAGGDALTQLWAFIVFPVIGAVVGLIAWRLVDDQADEPIIDPMDRAVDPADA